MYVPRYSVSYARRFSVSYAHLNWNSYKVTSYTLEHCSEFEGRISFSSRLGRIPEEERKVSGWLPSFLICSGDTQAQGGPEGALCLAHHSSAAKQGKEFLLLRKFPLVRGHRLASSSETRRGDDHRMGQSLWNCHGSCFNTCKTRPDI